MSWLKPQDIGKIVHYVVAQGEVRPMMITCIVPFEKAEERQVNGIVFSAYPSDYRVVQYSKCEGALYDEPAHTMQVYNVKFNETDKPPKTWHWPA